MKGSVFYWVLNMSMAASLLGCLVLLLRRIRLPRRVVVLLWVAPFVRMVTPILFRSRLSLFNLLGDLGKTVVVLQQDEEEILSEYNFIKRAKSYTPTQVEGVTLEKVFSFAGWIWLVGVVVILLLFVASYMNSVYSVRNARKVDYDTWTAANVSIPFVCGILKPRIILPEGYADRENKYILLHERMHIHRGDNIWRTLAVVITCVHWFNPFLWFCLREFLADLESSCDESVISKLGEEERQDYAKELLDAVESYNRLTLAFGAPTISKRIDRILSYKRISLFSGVCFAVLVTVIIFMMITNAT